jgi:hypothetical protein
MNKFTKSLTSLYRGLQDLSVRESHYLMYLLKKIHSRSPLLEEKMEKKSFRQKAPILCFSRNTGAYELRCLTIRTFMD